MRIPLVISFVLGLAGCSGIGPLPTDPAPQEQITVQQPIPTARSSRMFLQVVARVEPVAKQECRARSQGVNCDFTVLVDQDASLPPNAYQTFDKNNQPVVVFTQSLIADVQNADELAFILGHEAGHLIRGHIPRTQKQAQSGAIVAGVLAAVLGVGDAGIETAVQIGGAVGARRYSKNFELEADEMGAIIATHAGFDALKGAQYFSRIPDPGDQFLGSHPANGDRIETVRKTVASL